MTNPEWKKKKYSIYFYLNGKIMNRTDVTTDVGCKVVLQAAKILKRSDPSLSHSSITVSSLKKGGSFQLPTGDFKVKQLPEKEMLKMLAVNS